jgi:excisionase family DNA binding protein
VSAVTQLAPRSDGPGHPLTFRQLAAVLGVSRSTIYRAWRDGVFPVTRVRAAHRVNGRFADDLLAALGAGRCIVFEDFAAGWMAANPGEAAS